jgi:hypothetical protein
METAGQERGRGLLVWLAGALWLVSFFLPAARLGGLRGRPAPGILAAIYAAAILPEALTRLAVARPAHVMLGAGIYAALAGVFFLVLAAQNGLMLFLVAFPRRGRLARRLAATAAVLAWGVPLIDPERLYAGLGLDNPAGFRLLSGYFVWAVSFGVLAAGLFTERVRGRGPG